MSQLQGVTYFNSVLASGLQISIQSAAASLAIVEGQLEIPFLELALLSIEALIRDSGRSQLGVDVAGTVTSNAYRSARRGWEPVLEPWRCTATLEMAAMRFALSRAVFSAEAGC